ncbi:hypothetical protein C8Q80DRAFT_1266226 [Daedaleopsis nitida]|nr:hypothetical protein C8Q80DRAFT_1266226 [Daedaleopsis nitida]
MRARSRLLSLFGFCELILRCHAGQAFKWAIPDILDTSLRECDTHRITLSPLNGTAKAMGVPPYYMMAIAAYGTSSVSHIGDNSSELSWQVQNRRGTQLLLTVIDSAGQSGGFMNVFYDVVDGDTQCLPAAPSDPPVITANATATLNTCDSWGLLVTGGVKPYNLTLATPSSPGMTNVTMDPGDNLYTYINRASPEHN